MTPRASPWAGDLPARLGHDGDILRAGGRLEKANRFGRQRGQVDAVLILPRLTVH